MSSDVVMPEHKASASNAIERPASPSESVVFGKHETGGTKIRSICPGRIAVAVRVVRAIPARRRKLDKEQISSLVEKVVVNDAMEPALRLESVSTVSPNTEVVMVDPHGFRTSRNAYDAVVGDPGVGGAGINGQPS